MLRMQENQGGRRWWRQYWLPFAAVLAAAVLMLGAAVPSYAASTVMPPLPDKKTSKVRYVNFYSGYKDQGTKVLPRYVPVDVNSTVNPSRPSSSTAPKAATTTGRVLVGRVIAPGQTPLMLQQVFNAFGGNGATGVARGAGTALSAFGKVLGLASLGMGGVAEKPTNAVDLYRAQGVSEGCISNPVSCTMDEHKKVVNVNSCGISNTCASLGATMTPGSTDAPVVPTLADVWAGLTGQAVNGYTIDAETGHHQWTGNECQGRAQVVRFDPAQPANFQISSSFTGPGSSSTSCEARNPYPHHPGQDMKVRITCVDSAGRTTHPTLGGTYGGNAFSFDSSGNWVPVRIGSWQYDQPCRAPSHVAKVEFYSDKARKPTDDVTNVFNKVNADYTVWQAPEVDFTETTELSTDWSCKDRQGNVFTYSQTVKGTAAIVSPTCPEGTALASADVYSKTPANAVKQRMGGVTTKPEELSKYEDCVYGPGCAMEVHIDGEPCTVSRAACENWQQTYAKTPSKVQCKWGSYTVPVSNCNVLSEGYKTETGTTFDPGSGTWVGVDGYGQPVAPSPAPWNPTNPNPVPGVDPVTGVNPSTGTGPGTTPGTGTTNPTFPTTGTNPSTGGSCISGMWTWNPVDWVFVPAKCALQWAFVPSPTVLADKAAGVSTRLDLLGIKPLVDAVGVADDLPGEGGCMGPLVAFEVRDFSKDLYPFQACTEPMSTIAMGVNAFFSLGIVWAGGLSAIRAIGAGFGFNFSMRKGGDDE